MFVAKKNHHREYNVVVSWTWAKDRTTNNLYVHIYYMWWDNRTWMTIAHHQTNGWFFEVGFSIGLCASGLHIFFKFMILCLVYAIYLLQVFLPDNGKNMLRYMLLLSLHTSIVDDDSFEFVTRHRAPFSWIFSLINDHCKHPHWKCRAVDQYLILVGGTIIFLLHNIFVLRMWNR